MEPVAERVLGNNREHMRGARVGYPGAGDPPDQPHLFVRVWPSDCAAEVVEECKGYTSCQLRKEFPCRLKLSSTWTRSHVASTAGNVSQDTMKQYLTAQTER